MQTEHWSSLGVSVMWRNEAEVGRGVWSAPSLMGNWEVVITQLQGFGLLIQLSPLFTAYPGQELREKEAEQCLHWMEGLNGIDAASSPAALAPYKAEDVEKFHVV